MEEATNSEKLNGYINDFEQADLDNDGILEFIAAAGYKTQVFSANRYPESWSFPTRGNEFITLKHQKTTSFIRHALKETK